MITNYTNPVSTGIRYDVCWQIATKDEMYNPPALIEVPPQVNGKIKNRAQVFDQCFSHDKKWEKY